MEHAAAAAVDGSTASIGDLCSSQQDVVCTARIRHVGGFGQAAAADSGASTDQWPCHGQWHQVACFLNLFAPPSVPSADVDEQSKNEIKDILLTYDRTLLVADPRRCEPKKVRMDGRAWHCLASLCLTCAKACALCCSKVGE